MKGQDGPWPPETEGTPRQQADGDARYRILFEQAPVGIVVFDADRRIIDVNREFLRRLGYSRDDLIASDLNALVTHIGEHDRAAAATEVRHATWQVLRSDSSVMVADVFIRSIDDHCHVASIVDQPALQAALQRIELHRNLYGLLSRCSVEVARLHSKSEMYAAVTKLAVEHGRFLFAWVGEVDSRGRVMPVARYGDDRGYLHGLELTVHADQESGTGPTGRCIRQNATQVANDFRSDPATAPWRERSRAAGVGSSAAIPLTLKGVPIGALMVYSALPEFFSEDVVGTLEQIGTELSVALNALEARHQASESQNFLQTMIDASPNPAYALSLDGRVLAANKALCETFGIAPAKIIGLRREDVMPAAVAKVRDADDARVIQTGAPLVVEQPSPAPGDNRFFLIVRYPLRDTQGKIFGVAGFCTDITELRRAQRALEQANEGLEELVRARTAEAVEAREKAERAGRMKSAFLRTISHELRSPLNSILGFTEVLHQQLSGPVNEQQAEQLKIVQRCSQGMLDLVNELLDMSKIEAGRLVLDQQSFDLGALVRQKALSLKPLTDAKSLELGVYISPSVGAMIGDEKRVGQILTNLLSNAIKFTAKGRVGVSLTRAGPVSVLVVEDTGSGIPAEDMDLIFVPFEQSEHSQLRADSTGLGLPIARELARALGGDITVSSRIGEGSRFTVTLPLEPDRTKVPIGQRAE